MIYILLNLPNGYQKGFFRKIEKGSTLLEQINYDFNVILKNQTTKTSFVQINTQLKTELENITLSMSNMSVPKEMGEYHATITSKYEVMYENAIYAIDIVNTGDISKIDLSSVYDLCKHFYSSTPWGRIADYLPQSALRSLLVMYLAGFTSINKWVKELKDTPQYAYLSGFNPEKTPSKAYFSWFTSYLFGEDFDINDIMTQGTLLKKIFELIFVNKSIELGIIDPHDKVIFDGCKVKSFCKQKYVPEKYCRCSSNTIKCSMCKEPEATKGYDHNLDQYLIGYGLHFAATPMVDNHSKCLPLTFFVAGADVHDSKVVPHLLMYLYHDMKVDFNHVILDSGYDAYYMYWWISLPGGKPIIAINPKNSQTPTPENEYGLPVCPAGHVYYYWGIDKKRRRYKWRCPLKASKKLSKIHLKFIPILDILRNPFAEHQG